MALDSIIICPKCGYHYICSSGIYSPELTSEHKTDIVTTVLCPRCGHIITVRL